MSRRVRNAVAALFALTLVLQTPVAFAAPRERDRVFKPSFIQRVIKVVKQTLKPLGIVSVNDDDAYMPTPPKP